MNFGIWFSFDIGDRLPDGFRKSFIDAQNAVLGVLEKDHGGRQVEKHLKLSLASLQRLFSLLAFRYVTGNTRKTNQDARGISDLKATIMNPADCAVRASDSILNAHLRYGSRQRPEDRQDTFTFLWEDGFDPLLRFGIQAL